MKRDEPTSTIGIWLLGACLAGVSAGEAAAQEACFGPPKAVYDVGNNPRCVALGDVNGNGALDVAVANEFSSDVSVLLNTGAGTLAEQVRYAVGAYPVSVALGDVNGDGAIDLVVANSGDGDVSVLLNTGDGTLGAQVRYVAGAFPRSVAMGDVDGDGDLDLAIAIHGTSGEDGDVSILLNAGAGTFGAPVRYGAGDSPSAIALGDMNGDGALDVAVANRGTYSPTGDVSVLLNAGGGTFADQVRYPAGNPEFIALGDVNGDGALDVVARADGYDVAVLLNAGDGAFGAQVSHPAEGFSIALGDVDADGDLDLVTSTVVLANEGGGALAAATAHGATGTTLALGDVNGDGELDLVVANGEGNSNEVSVVMSAGSSAIGEQARWPAGDSPKAVALGDVNDDGALDFVVANYGGDDISVVLNAGGGTFADQIRYATGDYPGSVALGDLDGDGDVDVVVGNSGCCTDEWYVCWNQGISVLLNAGDGTFASEARYASSRAASVALGDVDGDGDLDVAVAVILCGIVIPSRYEVWILPNLGQGVFGDAVQHDVPGGVSSVVLGDLDEDGDLDLVTAAHVLFNEGGGSFADAVAHGAVGSDVAAGDVNGDGALDLVIANAGPGDTGGVLILLNTGGGTFGAQVRYAAGVASQSVALGDLTGDGALDVAVGNAASSDVSILVNAGDGTFEEQVRYWTARLPWSVALGDVSGNGALDLVVANYATDDVSILPNDCPPACLADLDGGGDVGFTDLTQLLSVWGGMLCVVP